MTDLDESVEQENADAPTDRTSRRERRDEAAGTLSRVLGARTGAGRRAASSESGSLSCRKRGRAVGRVRAGQGGGLGSSDASRGSLMATAHLRAGGCSQLGGRSHSGGERWRVVWRERWGRCGFRK